MRIKFNYFINYTFIFVFMRIKVNRFTQLTYMRKGETKFMPAEQELASAKNKEICSKVLQWQSNAMGVIIHF